MLRPALPWLGRRVGSLDYVIEGADGEPRHVIAIQAHAETDDLAVLSYSPDDPERYSFVTLVNAHTAIAHAHGLVATVTPAGDTVRTRLTT